MVITKEGPDLDEGVFFWHTDNVAVLVGAEEFVDREPTDVLNEYMVKYPSTAELEEAVSLDLVVHDEEYFVLSDLSYEVEITTGFVSTERVELSLDGLLDLHSVGQQEIVDGLLITMTDIEIRMGDDLPISGSTQTQVIGVTFTSN